MGVISKDNNVTNSKIQGTYIVVTEGKLFIFSEIESSYMNRVLGGIDREGLIKLHSMSGVELSSLTAGNEVLIFKYLGKRYKDKNIFQERVIDSVDNLDLDEMKDLVVINNEDKNYVMEWGGVQS